MLTDLVIENFQSVKDAHLKLGMFTVITGPTGSGKSATIRALRLAAFNRRGSDFIRRGAKACRVAIGSDDELWAVELERGGRGRDAYYLTTGTGKNFRATKLNGEAPPEILKAHGVTSLNFAGQFDHPYLLDATGSQIARILGDLTNVSLVYEAAREAARRKGRVSADMKRAETEVASLLEQVSQYEDLPAQRAAQQRAEAFLRQARELQTRSGRLGMLIEQVKQARLAVGAASAAAKAAEPPSLEHAEKLLARRNRLRELIAEAENARSHAAIVTANAEYYARLENTSGQAYRDALINAGACPVCGQEVTGVSLRTTLLASGQLDNGKAQP